MVNGLLFQTDFIILDMPNDYEMPLILKRPFLETGRALIHLELGS